MGDSSLYVVLVTVPNEESARKLSDSVVNERLAACVNILGGLRSVFHWNDRVENASELLLVIKTTSDRYPELESRIQELHPYETSEIVAIEAARVADAYLSWVHEETSRS